MKVTKTQSEPAFQPIELKITIESAEDLHLLKCITGSNCTNATAMANDGTLHSDDVVAASLFFAEVYNSLRDV